MKGKTVICAVMCAALLSAPTMKTDACTNVIVTKGASADGSILVSYAADSHVLFGELYFAPAADWKKGSMRKIVDWDTGKVLGEIPQVPHTYKRVGNMNEHQLIIAETTFGGRSELADETGMMDYGSLIYIALERCKTAKEAIQCMTSLVKEYGYYSEGETFTIADKNEVWIMEMVGKGKGSKGAVWVAVRIPDGYICAHANQSRIRNFPLKDPLNCIYSPDVIEFARKKGYFKGEDYEFSFADAYCPLDFSGMRACEARVWSAFNILSNGWFTFVNDEGRYETKEANTYLDFAMGYNADNPMPLYIQPSKKLTVKHIADVMRDHFEGTPMDMTQDIGAGGNALPYRWRPMSFEKDGNTYINERAIATQQTGFWFVGQSRSAFPDVIGGIIWFGTDDAATSYVTPIYTNTNEVPECFREGNGSMLKYSETSSFWINNRISNACYKMYDQMAPFVRKEINSFEKGQLEKVRECDNKALDLYEKAANSESQKAKKKGYEFDPKTETGDVFAQVKDLLTEYSVNTAQTQFNKWVELEKTLLVKFIDGNVKAQNEDGSFKHTEEDADTPADLKQPGYTDLWKTIVAREHGEVVKVPVK